MPKNLSPEQSQALARNFEQQPPTAILQEMRERLCQLLLKDRNARAGRPLARQLLRPIESLRWCGAPPQSLGETLQEWQAEIGRMWCFRRSNGFTEGFRNRPAR